MCTVTLTSLKAPNSFVLTSNRDEAPHRETLAPKIYMEEGVKMVFPKDVSAGGTWLGVSEKKRVVCLLNGAFKNHERKPPYRLSRGVVVKKLLAADDFYEAVNNFNFCGIEPFTLIAADWGNELLFSEVVWDGKQVHQKELSQHTSHIWSSSPLYTSEAKALREQWFQTLQQEKELTPETLLNFHFSAGKGDKNLGVVMDRGFVKTKSISQIVVLEERTSFYYKDIEAGEAPKVDLRI
jgi:uncharacterized protein with NRDE domain